MCIAIYSPLGNQVPNEENLKRSFEHNSDGAGFAFNTDKNNVQILKGYMTWDAFWKAFQKYDRKYDFKNRGVLIHFRITTHGGTNAECCHPFPLVADEGFMKKTKVRSDYAVIHNGIIDITSRDTHKRDKMSDTMVFIEKYLSKIATNKKWFKNDTNFELIYDMIDSKMAILNGYGNIKSTQGFTKDEEDGNYYSNTSYKEARVYNYYSGINYGTNYYKGNLCYPYEDDYDDYSWGEYYSRGKTTTISTTKSSLVKLEEDMVCILQNGKQFDYEEDFPIFMSSDGRIWQSTIYDVDERTCEIEEIYYVAKGWFYKYVLGTKTNGYPVKVPFSSNDKYKIDSSKLKS